MILHGSVIEVAFNVQAAVDHKHSLIVHYDTTNVNDRKALAPVALEAKAILQKEEITVLADKGYNNAEQIQTCSDNNITTYVAVQDVPEAAKYRCPHIMEINLFITKLQMHTRALSETRWLQQATGIIKNIKITLPK